MAHANLKPISLYTHHGGPNGWKVAIILEELGIPYTPVYMQFNDQVGGVKHPDYLKINPNGRIPAIVDHNNNDFTVWESAAILIYLAQKYDTEHKLYPSTVEGQATANQWIAYQISGLGPSQGQVNWFLHYHGEKLPSAVERYQNESKRIYAVLEKHLADKDYFLGDKFSIVDAAYVVWVKIVGFAQLDLTPFPNVQKWFARVIDRESVKAAYAKAPK